MEFNNVIIYHNELKFPSIYREVSNKFDLLFVTMKLMGYSIESIVRESAVHKSLSNYSIKSFKGSKYLEVEFGLCNNKVIDIVIISREGSRRFHVGYSDFLAVEQGFNSLSYPLNTEEDLVMELDRIMSYI